MLFEHWIYSAAIAIIAGMIHFKKTGRDYSWIIIASALAPDLDIFAGYLSNKFDIGILINGNPIKHGDFHNLLVLLLFAVFVGLLLKINGLKFKDSFIFAGIGFSAHLLEDVLVYNPGYAFMWPLSKHVFGIGIINYQPDFYGIANIEVLLAGIIAMILCGTIRTLQEGNSGLGKTMKAFTVAGIFLVMTIPMFGFYDDNLNDEVGVSNIVDKWQFTHNASWDSNISYNGSHSAKIEILGNKSKKSGIWKSNKIPAISNTNYTFSSWGKIKGVGGNNSPAVRIVEMDTNGKWIRQTNLVFSKGTHNWTKKQTKLKTNNNTRWVYVYANIWEGYGTFWFDDVGLYEEGTNHNIIPNSGFEMGVKKIINFVI